MTSFTDILNALRGVMTPEEFQRRREEERGRRVAATAAQIFGFLLEQEGLAFKMDLNALYLSNFEFLPKTVEEWQMLVARIIKAGWQCELRPVDDDYRWTHIVIAGPGEELPS